MILKIYFISFIFLLGCSQVAPRNPSSAPVSKYGKSVPLSLSFKSLSATSNETFWKIIPYYRPQLTDASCSLASTAMVINALIPSHTLDSQTQLFSEASLLKIARSSHWERAVAEGGKGMPLKDLSEELSALLPKLRLNSYSVGFREILTEADKIFFKEALIKQMKGDGWIILNYDQGTVMGSGSYGHFSPVASFNPINNSVLILDTDASWYEPYWVSLDLLTQSMQTHDAELKNARGFIWIFKD